MGPTFLLCSTNTEWVKPHFPNEMGLSSLYIHSNPLWLCLQSLMIGVIGMLQVLVCSYFFKPFWQLGLIIRAATSGHIPQTSFVLVTMGSTGILLIGWRALISALLPNDQRKKNDVYRRGSPFELFEVRNPNFLLHLKLWSQSRFLFFLNCIYFAKLCVLQGGREGVVIYI